MTAPLRIAALALAATLAGCVHVRVASAPADPTAEIVEMLRASTVAWDAGDLDGFLVTYLDSPEITFVGSTGLVRGKAATRAKYASSYFAAGPPKGRLAFRDIEVGPLGPDHALAVGRYVLTDRATGAESTGWFSLTLRRTPEGWRIVHDHSS